MGKPGPVTIEEALVVLNFLAWLGDEQGASVILRDGVEYRAEWEENGFLDLLLRYQAARRPAQEAPDA